MEERDAQSTSSMAPMWTSVTHQLKLNKKGAIKSNEKKLQRKIPQQKKK